MAKTSYCNGNYFAPIRTGNRCPICGAKDGRCSIYFRADGSVIFYACRNVCSSDGMTSNGLYKHYEERNFVPEEIQRIRDHKVNDEQITPEILGIRDRVNRRIPELMEKITGTSLFERDKADLIRRGLTDKEIKHMGIHSAPISPYKHGDSKERVKYLYYDSEKGDSYYCLLETAIVKELYKEFGDNLLLVAGFNKRSGDKGDYISMTTKFRHPVTEKYTLIQGYFIPYHNEKGQRVASQYRLTVPFYEKKEKNKYSKTELEIESILLKAYKNEFEALIEDILVFQEEIKKDSNLAYKKIKKHFKSKGVNHNTKLIFKYVMKIKVSKIRYRWWVGQSSTGSPTDFYTPTSFKEFTDKNGNKIRIAMITEGALKGKIACEKFGCQGLFMAGVTMYHSLIATLTRLEKLSGIKYHIIIALDMDKYDNYKIMPDNKKFYPILKAESTLSGLLKGRGSQVAIMEWNKKIKGVDEAMIAGLKRIWKDV